jgi:hypothetical protein
MYPLFIATLMPWHPDGLLFIQTTLLVQVYMPLVPVTGKKKKKKDDCFSL